MATFTNQATLNFGTSSLNSNVTTGEVQAALSLTKTAVSQNYGAGDGITYILSLVNNGTTDVTGVTLTDDLGAYSLDGGTTTLVPLDYVDGHNYARTPRLCRWLYTLLFQRSIAARPHRKCRGQSHR